MQQADFRFKQFSIWHDQCAMKVNTDGILLGAWTELNQAKQIADIGTGTGLIALMLAQKGQNLKQQINISAIEIDQAAAQQASFNVAQSPWQNLIDINHQSFQQFSEYTDASFDLLVSNPPYFTDSLQAPDKSRNLARHNHGLSFQQLLENAAKITTAQARFNLILPCNEAERLLQLAPKYDWQLQHHCKVSTVTAKQPSRSLLSLDKGLMQEPQSSELTIRNKDNSYHQSFIELCQDFYLFM